MELFLGLLGIVGVSGVAVFVVCAGVKGILCFFPMNKITKREISDV